MLAGIVRKRASNRGYRKNQWIGTPAQLCTDTDREIGAISHNEPSALERHILHAAEPGTAQRPHSPNSALMLAASLAEGFRFLTRVDPICAPPP